MTDRFVTVPDSLELPAAVKVPVARLVGPTGAAATPADLGAATAEQGELADTAVQPGDLGNAAGLDVGAAAGTVMAGDDSRVTSLSSTYGAAITAIEAAIPTLTNLVTNGDFSDGTSGWSFADDSGAVVAGQLVVTTVTSPQTAGTALSSPTVTGNVYYVAFDAKQSATGSNVPRFYLGTTLFGTTGNTGTRTNDTLQQHATATFTASGAYTHFAFYSYVAAAQTVTYDNVILIDLTATFGAGNEPTAAQMDTILASVWPETWIDGTTLLRAQAQSPLLYGLTALGAATGLVAKTGAGTFVDRDIAAGTGLAVTNGDGVAGNPTVGISEGAFPLLANQITNGDFSNGITGWAAEKGTGSDGGGFGQCVGDGTAAYHYLWTNCATSVVGHVYYYRFDVRTPVGAPTSVRVYRAGQLPTCALAVGENVWVTQSGTVTATATDIQLNVYVYWANAGAQSGKTMQVDNANCIDLTATFGAGAEPTAAQMDAIVAGVWGAYVTTTTAVSAPLRAGMLAGSETRYPDVVLPTDFSAVVGDTLELFNRGMLDTHNPEQWPHRVVCAKGSDYGRKWAFTPAAGDVGSHTLRVDVTDLGGTVKRTATSAVVVKAAANPAANVRVTCIGDSLTAGLQWPEEAYRRLTQAGGTPAGHGFTNFEFVGATPFPNFATQGAFGTGGWTATSYITAGSPFWTGSAYSFKSWFDTNEAGVGPDQVIILLGWNSSTDTPTLTAERTLVAGIHADYPTCKILMLGIQYPSPSGGLGVDYGANALLADYARVVRYVNRRAALLKAFATESAWGGTVRYAALAPQFDSDWNMQYAAAVVNTRSATTELRGTNGVHPATAGYLQIADVAYRELIRAWS